MSKKTLLSGATSSARSKTVAYGGTGGGGEICITARGTMGSGSATVDVSHDGTNWVITGTSLTSSAPSCIVSLRPGMVASVNYTAGGGSSWTVEAS